MKKPAHGPSIVTPTLSRRGFARLLWVAALAGCSDRVSPDAVRTRVEDKDIPTYGFEVVKTFPHDPRAFTQGLVFHDGKFYESTGQEGESSLRHVEIETGKVLTKVDLARDLFGEGLALIGDELFQLTWKNGIAIVYDRATLREKRRHRYQGEGWGLAYDGTSLVMSDGTATLRFIDPKTFRVVRRVSVTIDGTALKDLNELEYIDGEVWANVWYQDGLARIDPKSGKVTGWVNLGTLWPQKQRPSEDHVLNGIAYDATGKRLFVTGKYWPKLYEIRLVQSKD